MSLINCPECQLPVSTAAETCPHCGFPLKNHTTTRKRSSKTHLRLPNGFGQITELKNPNLRNRFRVMITIGKTETGKPICKILKPQGYFRTYNEAYEALVKYNLDPYSVEDVLTVSDLYDRWSADYFEKVTASSKRTVEAAWAYCSAVENINVLELKGYHIKGCIDECPKESIKGRIKSIFNLMLDYALERDLVKTNVARTFKVERTESEEAHHSFTKEEMEILWKNASIPFICYVLIQCYTGWRPQELCNIKLEDVDFTENIIKGGMKTKAGKNRIVPICNKILPTVKKIYAMSEMLGSNNLICDLDGSSLTYDKYYKRFQKAMNNISIVDHSPHDPRKQFITMAKSAGVDEYAIKRLVGHSINDITEKIYTARDLAWLRSEVNKI